MVAPDAPSPTADQVASVATLVARSFPTADAAIGAALDLIRDVLGLPSALVIQVAGETWEATHVSGLDGSVRPGVRFRIPDMLRGPVITRRAPVTIDDSTPDGWSEGVPVPRRDARLAYTGVPLLQSDGEVIGTLCVHGERAETLTGSDLAVLNAVASFVASELEHEQTLAALIAREAHLRHLAFQDPVTGLPNRALFLDRLSHALSERGRREGSTAVFFIDLDDFKRVNDELGHAAGDEVLAAVGHRLSGALRAGDTAARFGGDEFTLLIPVVDHPNDALVIADRVLQALAPPFEIRGHTVRLGASIGIAVTTTIHGDAQEVLRGADTALLRAKASGKGGYALFDPTHSYAGTGTWFPQDAEPV